MKRTIILLTILFSCFVARATNFVFVVATTDTAVAHWVVAVNQADSDQAHITALGARPTAPLYDSTAAQWATFTASAFTYDSSLAVYNAAYNADIVTQATAEVTVLSSLGYGTAYTNILVNQWVKVSGNNFTTQWIGYNPNNSFALCQACVLSPHLTVVFSQPCSTCTYPKR